MALFKILRGNSSKLFDEKGNISTAVPFNDGYCYFTPDNKKFYIDWLDESNKQHRDPLNSLLADTLLYVYTDSDGNTIQIPAKLVGGSSDIKDSNEEIPTSAVLHSKFDVITKAIKSLNDDKMDKQDPYGFGHFSLNSNTDYTLGKNSVAIGNQTAAPGQYSFAEGDITIANGESSHTEGKATIASAKYAHAEGDQTKASAIGCHSEGFKSESTGDYSHAEGYDTRATGYVSHSEGSGSIASGAYTHAEGRLTRARGLFSHAQGLETTASHKSQHVEGEYNIIDTSTAATDARGTYVHIIGNGTSDTARSNALTLTWDGDLWHSGKLSHGNQVSAKGLGSYSGGTETSSLGNYSHAEGIKTTSQGGASHSEGEDTSAIGTSSHAEGYGSVAQGSYSHAQNQGTIAYGDSSTAIGKFNIADTKNTKAFIIGNGTADDKRSNMFFIDWDGNACYKNTLLIGDDAIAPNKITGVKLYVEGNSYFKGDLTIGENYHLISSAAPSNNNHLVNKKYVDDNLMRLNHYYMKADKGQAAFDFGKIGIKDITNYYLVYFNGLLLIEGIHYAIENKKIVNLLGWAATEDDYLQLVSFKPNNPTA